MEPRSDTCYSTILTTVQLMTHGKFAKLKSGIYSIVTGKPTDHKRFVIGVMATAGCALQKMPL